MASTKPETPAKKRGGRPARGSEEKTFGASGLVDAVETGERVKALLALRLHIAERIETGVPARDLAALSLRLMQVIEELDALGANPDTGAKPTAEDELAARRVDVLRAAGVRS
jgi:hypothetical protein